jgi:hypothetical protein
VKKRSKLDIAAGVEQDKPQAAGFSEAPAADPAADPAAEPQDVERPASASARVRQSRQSVVVERRRSSAALALKTLAAVAIAALALYLLKRRLF